MIINNSSYWLLLPWHDRHEYTHRIWASPSYSELFDFVRPNHIGNWIFWFVREYSLRPLPFHISLQNIVLNSVMFRKIIINASCNLKRGVRLVTKIKSNGCLDIAKWVLRYSDGGSNFLIWSCWKVFWGVMCCFWKHYLHMSALFPTNSVYRLSGV